MSKKILVTADYSQVELRIAAEVSGDKAMLEAFRNDGDLHAKTAENISGRSKENQTKEDRNAAKICNFALLYGAGAKSLREYARINFKVLWTAEQAEEYVMIFRDAYPEFRQWQVETTKNAKETLFATTVLGKHRALHPEAYYTTSLNQPIQGAAAEVMKIALINLDASLERVPGAFLISTVHDEVGLECYPKDLEEVKEILEIDMAGAMLQVFPNAHTKGLIEINYGETWYDAK